MDLGLRGKSVLITGGSKGIGLACARAFLDEGARVHLAARDAARLEQARAGLKGDVTVHPADLRDGAALKALAAECRHADILVNNAGDIPGGTLEALDEQRWRHAWELKVFGYINLTRELYTRMRERGSGVIVNVIGMAGENPSFEYICGTTANAGLAAFTRALGKGSHEHGIRVVGLHPPATRTDRILQLMKTTSNPAAFGRVIEPEQVGDTVAFLASARAGQLSGVVLNLGT
jgi:NAD(P)-dependent dehydrogenase (short-subunit alcohol dehydrogenase family)